VDLGIGPETSVGLQAVLSDFLVPGGFGTVSLRYFAGEFVDTTSMLANTRLPVPLLDGLRVSARLRADHRRGSQDQVELLPSLRADWRGRHLLVEAGVGLDWVKGLNGAVFADQLSYFTEVILRWDF